MIYREYLVMRKAVAWFVAILVAGMLILRALSHGSDTLSYAGIVNTSGWLAAIFASIFGVALGNGSRQAARVLWVLPTERWKLALQMIAVDLLGATVAFACVSLLLLTQAGLRFGATIHGSASPTDIVMALALVYAACGWSALAGTLGRRIEYSGIIVLSALMIWLLLARSEITVGSLLRGPIAANPFAVYNTARALQSWNHHAPLGLLESSLQWLGTTWGSPILVAIAIATCGLAVALWHRAQVIN